MVEGGCARGPKSSSGGLSQLAHRSWSGVCDETVRYSIRTSVILHAIHHLIMTNSHPRDPLHGITLEKIVTTLVERHGWTELGRRLPVRCFLNNPSVKSSLTFLRKTQWARERVEGMYIAELE